MILPINDNIKSIGEKISNYHLLINEQQLIYYYLMINCYYNTFSLYSDNKLKNENQRKLKKSTLRNN